MLEEFGKFVVVESYTIKYTCRFPRLRKSKQFNIECSQNSYLTQRKPLGRANEDRRTAQQLQTLESLLGRYWAFLRPVEENKRFLWSLCTRSQRKL
jgi:hypothetical protein